MLQAIDRRSVRRECWQAASHRRREARITRFGQLNSGSLLPSGVREQTKGFHR